MFETPLCYNGFKYTCVSSVRPGDKTQNIIIICQDKSQMENELSNGTTTHWHFAWTAEQSASTKDVTVLDDLNE